MKILYDHLCFQEIYGGVSKYFVNMLKQFPLDVQYEISVKYTKNEYVKTLHNIKLNNNLDNINIRGKWRLWKLFHFINQNYSKVKLLFGNYDIYHQTHYNPFAYKYLPSTKKSVTTIHDMNFFVIPEAYRIPEATKNWARITAEWQKKSASKADKIIAVSKNTKKDLIDIWNIPEEKIIVCYHGRDDISIENLDATRKFQQPYILFVGARLIYKNFAKYLGAFKVISERNKDLILVCTGYPFNSSECNLINDLRLSDKIFQTSVDEDEMAALYHNAEVFVYPSLYEGFGLPLLEAMNAQCPIICSNTSCFPEICEKAALYFDPYSIDDMVDVTTEILNNSSLKMKLIEEGNKRKKMFSWKKCAEEHIDVYKSLMKEYGI
jgi:glycosyltransferase involved in cell wall biosynthesis